MSWYTSSMRRFLCIIALVGLTVAMFSGAFHSVEVNAQSAAPETVFSNPAFISIPDGPAIPYPSTIAVTGLTGTVTKVTVRINGLSHTWPDDIGMLLVGPTGVKVRLMSDTGGAGLDISDVTLTFDDAAANSLPDSSQIVSGTYKPT